VPNRLALGAATKEKDEASGREQVKNTRNGAWYKSVWERVKRTRAPSESIPDDHNISQHKKRSGQVKLTEVAAARGKQRNLARPKRPPSPSASVHSEDLTNDEDSEEETEGGQGGQGGQNGQVGQSGQGGQVGQSSQGGQVGRGRGSWGSRGGIGQGGRGSTLTVDEEPVPLIDVCCFCLCFSRKKPKPPAKRS